ncbi:MAG TPA: hypothetical protein VIQ80_00925 [Candidatus Saccharimonadales bacterium]
MATVDFKNDNRQAQDEQYDPYGNARDLYRQEQEAPQSLDDSKPNTDSTDKTSNINDTRSQEEAPSSTPDWKTDVSEKGSTNKKQPTTIWAQIKKRGPLGAIIGLVGGGGIIGGGFLSPAGLIIHLKEIFVNKLDTMSPVMGERSDIVMGKRMFGTNLTCKIKVRCRFSGLTSRQMDRLRIQGAEILDKDGKPITKNALGRYTGGKTLVMPDGSKIEASAYKKSLRSNSALRDISRSVFAPRYMSWNDSISKDIRAKKRLVTNPEWGNAEDEKDTRKNVLKAVAGEGFTAQTQDVPASEKPPTTDPNTGKPVQNPPVDLAAEAGDMAATINDQAATLTTAAQNGDPIPTIPSDPAGAASLPETPIKGNALKSIVGFFNPADILVGLCNTYKLTKTIVFAARALVVVNAMRFASQFFSSADKLKAGEGTSNDAEAPAKILERTDQYGDSFGDSVSYQYTEYGSVPDKPIAFSLAGNGVVLILTAIVSWINSHLGKTLVNDGCKVLTNPFVQGALALSSFIPGGGQIVGVISKVGVKAAEVTAKELITNMVKKMAEAAIKKASDAFTKDALKSAAKTVGKEFLKLAATAGGIFLASYLTERYAIPFLARIISNTSINADMDGVAAVDTIFGGFQATNNAASQEGGEVALSQQQAASFYTFANESTATYVADMRAQSNPFDVNNPYSMSNNLAASFYTFASKIKSSSLLALPGAIFSAFNPAKLFSGSTVFADSQVGCPEDTYLNDHHLASTPACGPKTGVVDVNFLQTADPDTDVTTWMLDNKQIDNDGNAIPDSDFAKYQTECLTDSPIIDPDLAGDSPALPETCYDTQLNETTERKMFSMYIIDNRVTNAMDGASATSADVQPSTSAYDVASSMLQSALAQDTNDTAVASTVQPTQPAEPKPLEKALQATGSLANTIPNLSQYSIFSPFTGVAMS